MKSDPGGGAPALGGGDPTGGDLGGSAPPALAPVLHGQCSWTDELLVKSNKFYPPSVRTSEEQLKFYASKFPFVEIDTSNYAIPSPKKVADWVARTPPGFLFHFKIFGLLCGREVQYRSMPWQAKQLLPAERFGGEAGTVSMADLSEEAEEAVWGAFHAAVQPAAEKGRLGLVVFQFAAGFGDTGENRAWIARCAEKMRPHTIAVELRAREWYAPAAGTADFLRSIGAVRVTVDERDVENVAPEAVDANPEAGRPVPLEPAPSHAELAYVRVHRRAGPARLLRPPELQRWLAILAVLRAQVARAVFIAWNTNEADQSVQNAYALSRMLEPDSLAEWERKRLEAHGGGIKAMFARAEARGREAAPAPAPADAGGGAGEAAEVAEAAPDPPATQAGRSGLRGPGATQPAAAGASTAPGSPKDRKAGAPASPGGAGAKRAAAGGGGSAGKGKKAKGGQAQGPPPGQASLKSFFGPKT
eukprot:tig00021332_g20335.t1